MIIDRVLMDFETRSSAPITAGPNRYAADRYARAWCVSWGFRANGGSWSGPCVTIIDGGRAGVPAVVEEMSKRGYDVRPLDEFLWVCDRARVRVAHNAPFEAAFFRWTLGRDYPAESWSCTLARSTRLGLPPALEGVLQVLGAPVAKDMEGNALSKKMGAPIGFSADGSPLWLDDFGSVIRCAEYCVTDFVGEAWLDDTLPELEPREQAIFVRQTKENNRGLNIDWDLVANGRAVTAATVEFVNRELPSWTGGELKSITQPGALLKWVRRRGVDADSLDAETLDLLLDSHPDLPDDVRVVLTARRSIRTSAAKLDALLARRMPDWCGESAGRVCDLTQYGAARTLRTVGRGFQPLNLPRPGDVDVEKGLAALKAMDFDGMLQAVSKEARTRQPSDKAGVKTFKGPRAYVFPTEVVAACLRAAIIPAPGCKFVAVDYSGVEARGVLAMAMETTAVQMFLDGVDIYCELAEQIYGYKVNKHDNVEERQLGKQGCLPGLTFLKFRDGMRPIEFASPAVEVWDGEKWTRFSATLNQGTKDVVERFGVVATPDHKFLLGNKWVSLEDVTLGMALNLSARNRETFRLQDIESRRGVFSDITLCRALAARTNSTLLRLISAAITSKAAKRAITRQDVICAVHSALLAAPVGSKRKTLTASRRLGLASGNFVSQATTSPKKRRSPTFSCAAIAGPKNIASIYTTSTNVKVSNATIARAKNRTTVKRITGPMPTSSKTMLSEKRCSTVFPQCAAVVKTQKTTHMKNTADAAFVSNSKTRGNACATSRRLKVSGISHSKSTGSTTVVGMNPGTFASSLMLRTWETVAMLIQWSESSANGMRRLPHSRRSCETFDLQDCGPNARFEIITPNAGVIAHNCLGCGFGMSRPLTFVDTCKGYGIYIDELMGERVIKAYSTKFPKAVDLWFSLHRSAKSAMNNPETWIGDKKYGVYYFHIPAGKWLGGIPWLLAWLPSGRIMYYPGARMLAGEWGEFISVMSWKNKRWISQTLTRQVTIENVIQAICRDAMEDDKADIVAAFEADPRGPVNHVVLTVYDEILSEIWAEDCEQIVGEGKHAMSAPQSWVEGVMTRPLPWFPLMPRGAEGWTGTEYRK